MADCQKPVAARGLCSMHYWRLNKKGDLGYERKRPSPQERFWKFVAEPDDAEVCWEWRGSRMKNGYGRIGVYPQGMVPAHRFVLIPSFGLWAVYRLVREVADEFRAFRSGRDTERAIWRADGYRW